MRNFLYTIFIGWFAAICLPSALACPPPNYPLGWKPPTFEEATYASYKEARDVVVVEVIKVEKKESPGEGTPYGWIEKAYVRPLTVYKGKKSNVPSYFEIGFSGTTCDKKAGLIQGQKSVVFLNADGRLVEGINHTDMAFEKTLQLLKTIPLHTSLPKAPAM